jgi:hypothetical protein
VDVAPTNRLVQASKQTPVLSVAWCPGCVNPQVAKVQRMVSASRQSVERARRQAELEAPLNDALKRRLEALPDDM